jgi:SpoVK/Ycf46/Vps4 family AAA+-type ATPase
MATAVEPALEKDGRWEILVHLHALDQLLKRAVVRARQLYGVEPNDESFRGIYISEEEIDSLIERESETLHEADYVRSLNAFHFSPRIQQLCECWDFNEFDTAVLLLAVAPEIDLRYGRIYAYLQDDVTRRRPTVDLVLNLLCDSQESRLQQRSRFAPENPLRRSGLLKLVSDSTQPDAPLLTQSLRLDERSVRAILGDDTLDSRLFDFCERTSLPPLHPESIHNSETLRRLQTFAGIARSSNRALRVLFSGPALTNEQDVAEAISAIQAPVLLTADMKHCESWRTEPEEIASLLKREATLTNAIIFVNGFEVTTADEAAARLFLEVLDKYPGPVVVGSDSPLVSALARPDRYLILTCELPDYEARRHIWEQNMNAAGIPVNPETLDALANNFRLVAEEIGSAVKTARQRLEWRITASGTITSYELESELFAAARGQTGLELAALTEKLTTQYEWEDVVLPDDTISQLREICQRVRHSHAVLERGGFGKKLSSGKGVAVLFAGPSGTGKTMSAEVIANDLGLDLFRIDLSSVVSKYIGETEKNLERIFAAATRSNSVLLFDEADALFGKRSQVNDAHDRYANVEISYLLQKMEQYEGITILTSNLRGNIDEGFWRRLAFTVHFPFPDEGTRLVIWKRIWPAETEVDEDVDFEKLAHRFSLSGGNIRNVGLSAAFLAASENRSVNMQHILHAIRREYTKVGKTLSVTELDDVVQ